jgi:hypothetical protein
MTKPGHILAVIATQLVSHHAEKIGGGTRIVDHHISNPTIAAAPHPRDSSVPQMPKVAGRLLKTSDAGCSRSHEMVGNDPMFHTLRSR